MKQTVIFAAIALIIIAASAVGAAFYKAGKPTPTPAGDMSSMHAPPPPADEVRFKSLLGNEAPGFSLQGFDGKTYNLAGLKGKNVVLFFSEGAMCYPSCWAQINEFTRDKNKFGDKNAVVVTIVVDSKSDWAAAVKKDPKLGGAVVLLDSDKKVSQTYGVLTLASSMHRGQFPGHTYVILDSDGVVKYEYDDEGMGVRNYELLSELGKLI